LAQAKKAIVCVTPISNALRMKASTSPWTSKKRLELRLFMKGFQGFFKHRVSMSSSWTSFSKYSVSGSQNYFLKISVNNVKSLFIWLNTNFGEPPVYRDL